MSGFRIEGNTSGNVLEVTANNEVKVIGPSTVNANDNPQINGGFVNNIYEADNGGILGYPTQRQGDISANYRQRVAVDSIIFNDQFNGTAINTTLWNQAVATMTLAVANGFLVLNSGSSVAVSASAQIKSYRSFPAYGTYPLQIEIQANYAAATMAIPNNITEIGVGFSSGTTAPTDGAFFRYTAAGTLICVLNYNGSETVSSTLALPTVNSKHHYNLVIGNDTVEFWIDNTLYANISVPTGNGMPLINQNTFINCRTYNTATAPSSAVQLKISNVSVSIGDMNMSKPWADTQVGLGGHSSQGQTGATTLGTTALYVNNANPTPAVPTNTAATLGSGLGGNFWSTATLAVNTDGIVSSYQVPAATVANAQKNLYITHIRIESAVQTTLVGGPFLLQWGLAYGHTSVTLAATEGAGTKAPRRLPLGFQSFVTLTAGTLANFIDIQLETPIIVQPGEFIQTIYKNIGTVGTAGTIAHVVMFNGYWE